MMNPTNSLAYRRAALQHASTVGLVIALYDTLHGNLSRAAAALERNDIQTRCAELVHGFNVLQQLEFMVDTEKGGKAAANLHRFYGHIRKQMLAAQFKLSPAILREQMKMLIEVRGAWEQVDARNSHHASAPVAHGVHAGHSPSLVHAQLADAEIARSSFSCSV